MSLSKKSTRPVKAIAKTVKPAAKTAVKTATKVVAKAATKTAAKSPAKPVRAAKPAAPTPAPTPIVTITTEIIATRAYILWEQAGCPHGRDREFWLAAETQLKAAPSLRAA